MPSTSSTASTVNGTRKSYISRVLSVNGSSKTEQNLNGSSKKDSNNNNNYSNNNPFLSRNGSFRSSKNLKRANEELRSHLTRLKAEIELEKIKSKQTHRDKVAEIKRIKDHYERANNLSIEAVTSKMKNLSEIELKKLKESLNRDKDAEIKQIIKFKDEEIRTLQKTMQEETERLNRQMHYSARRQRFGGSTHLHDDPELSRLKRELRKLHAEKENLEEKFSEVVSSANNKNEIIKKLKVDHERELQKILRQARRENSQSISELQTLKKSLQEKDTEISRLDSCVLKVTEEKDHLEERFDRSVLLTSTFSSDVRNLHNLKNENEKRHHTKTLQSQNADLKTQLDTALQQLKNLKKDASNNLNSTNYSFDLSKSFRLDAKNKQLKTRNSELVAIAKKLEEKAKHIQYEYTNYKEEVEKSRFSEENSQEKINSLKTNFSKQRAKDLTEHACKILIKDQEIEQLRKESPRLEELEASLHLSEKERMRLEHQIQCSPLRTSSANDNIQRNEKLAKEERDRISREFEAFQQLHTSCVKTTEELVRKKKQFEDISKQLVLKENECVALSKSLMLAQQEMGYLKKEMSVQEDHCQLLKQENELQRVNIKSMERSYQEMATKVKRMVQLETECDRLKEELEEKTQEYSIMVAELRHLKETIESLNQRLFTSERRAEELLMENTEVQSKLVERDDEITRLHQELSDIQATHRNEISDTQRQLHDIRQQNQTLRQAALHLNQQVKEREDLITRSVAVQTDSDRNCFPTTTTTATGQQQNEQRRFSSYDTVFESPPTATATNFMTSSTNKQVTITVTKPTVTSSTEEEESEADENFSLRSAESIMGYAARRIDELAASESDATSFSIDHRPFPANISGIPPHDAIEHGHETDDDISIDELTLDEFQIAISKDEEDGPPFSLDLENQGFPVKMFVAKYTYDPSLYSPNADHDMELPFIAGDRVYIYGDVDEDGFYIGELKSGQRGLVPSNLVEYAQDEYEINEELPFDVSDSDLSEVKKCKQGDGKAGSPLAAEYLLNTNRLKQKANKPITAVTSVLDDRDFILALDVDGTTAGKPITENTIPGPSHLEVERQIGNSVVVKWTSIAEKIDGKRIKGFSIHVDGKPHQTVLGAGRSKALVSDLNLEMVTRISVSSLTYDDETSDETKCSILIGGGENRISGGETETGEQNESIRRQENEVIANFFEQLKRVASRSSVTSPCVTENKNEERPSVYNPENEERPSDFNPESEERARVFNPENEDRRPSDFNPESEERPRVYNPENEERPRVYNPENEERPRVYNPENEERPRVYNPENEERPRVYNPENEERPRVYNPENSPHIKIPEGERIVISDDELSVIMEETESNELLLIPDDSEYGNPPLRDIRASPDGEENTATSNALRLTLPHNIQESYGTLAEISTDDKFKSVDQLEIHPSEIPLFEAHPNAIQIAELAKSEFKGSQETLAQVTELTENSPSATSALLTDFGGNKDKPSATNTLADVGGIETENPNEVEGRINDSLKLLEPLNQTDWETSSESIDSIDQGITTKYDQLSHHVSSSLDDLESSIKSPILSDQRSGVDNNESGNFSENGNVSKYQDYNPLSLCSSPRSLSDRSVKRNSLVDSSPKDRNIFVKSTPSDIKSGSVNSSPRLISNRSSKRNSLQDTDSQISSDIKSGSVHSSPRLISNRSSKRNSLQDTANLIDSSPKEVDTLLSNQSSKKNSFRDADSLKDVSQNSTPLSSARSEKEHNLRTDYFLSLNKNAATASPIENISKTKSPNLPYDITYGSYGNNNINKPSFPDRVDDVMKDDDSPMIGGDDNGDDSVSPMIGGDDNSDHSAPIISKSSTDEIRNSLLRGLEKNKENTNPSGVSGLHSKSDSKSDHHLHKSSKQSPRHKSIDEKSSNSDLLSLLQPSTSSKKNNGKPALHSNKNTNNHNHNKESSTRNSSRFSPEHSSQATDIGLHSLPNSNQATPRGEPSHQFSESESESSNAAAELSSLKELLLSNSVHHDEMIMSNSARPPLQGSLRRKISAELKSKLSSRNSRQHSSQCSPDISQRPENDMNSLPNSLTTSPRICGQRSFSDENNSDASSGTKSKNMRESLSSQKSSLLLSDNPSNNGANRESTKPRVLIQGKTNQLTDVHPIDQNRSGIVFNQIRRSSEMSSISSQNDSDDEVENVDEDSIESEFALSSMKLSTGVDFSSTVPSQSLGASSPLVPDDDDYIDSQETKSVSADNHIATQSVNQHRPIQISSESNGGENPINLLSRQSSKNDHNNPRNSASSSNGENSINMLSRQSSKNDHNNARNSASSSNGENSINMLSRQSSKNDHNNARNSASLSTKSARRSLHFATSGSNKTSDNDDDSVLSEPIKITKPIKNLYSLAGYDVSLSSDNHHSDDDDETEFDVTPMVTLTLNETDLGITESKLMTVNDGSEQDSALSPGEIDNTNDDLDKTNDDGLDITEDSRQFRIFIALYSYDPITMSPNKENACDELAFKKDQFIKIVGEIDEDGFYFGELNGRSGYVPSNMVAEVDTMSHTILDSSADVGLSDDGDDDDPIGVNETRKSDSFDLSHMLKPSKVVQSDNEENEPINEDGDDNEPISELNKSLSASVPILSAASTTREDNANNENFLPTSYSLPELQNSSEEDDEGGSTGRKRTDPYQLKPRLMVALFDYDPAASSPNVDSEIELSFAAGQKIEVFGDMDEDGFFNGKLNGRKGLIPSNFVSPNDETDVKVVGGMSVSSSQESLGTKSKKKRKNIFKKSVKLFSKLKGMKKD